MRCGRFTSMHNLTVPALLWSSSERQTGQGGCQCCVYHPRWHRVSYGRFSWEILWQMRWPRAAHSSRALIAAHVRLTTTHSRQRTHPRVQAEMELHIHGAVASSAVWAKLSVARLLRSRCRNPASLQVGRDGGGVCWHTLPGSKGHLRQQHASALCQPAILARPVSVRRERCDHSHAHQLTHPS